MTGKEHPRPDFKRSGFVVLDGEWHFEFDDLNVGLTEHWEERHSFSRKIQVPYVFQCQKSGINETEYHPVLWYAVNFNSSYDELNYSQRIHLVFGAADFFAMVFINGKHVCNHHGGYLPFSADISDYLLDNGEPNLLVVRIEDSNWQGQLRGKQNWSDVPHRCWYIPSSGIWQTVYLESRPEIFIDSVQLVPDVDKNTVVGHICFNRLFNGSAGIRIMLGEALVANQTMLCNGMEVECVVKLPFGDNIDETWCWSPDNPVLFQATISIATGDIVTTYFGMRKVEVMDGMIFLNNKPFFQRLVLDQGYFENALLTGTEEDFKQDLKIIKEFGFNGVRMHQKIESPAFYHLADKMGLVVWGELPSGYEYCQNEREQIVRDMTLFVMRDFNHPSIICWVPFNESWGIRKICSDAEAQKFAQSIYYLLKAIDSTRLVSTNDGWEQVISDVCSIHDYAGSSEVLHQRWENAHGKIPVACPQRKVYADGYSYAGQPVIISEFGGIALKRDLKNGSWGYDCGCSDEAELVSRIKALVSEVEEIPGVCGYCYTQLTDVFQEVNGLTDMSRRKKIALGFDKI